MSTEKEAQLEAVAALDIGQLRRAASLLGVKSEKTWTKDDFVKAIQAKQESDELMSAVFDLNVGPAPGYSRVVIYRDPSPNHSNGPIHVVVNGRILGIPRGMEIDIPTPHVEVLKNAVSVSTESEDPNNKNAVFKEQSRMSYPFQVLASTPGPFVNTNDARAAKYARRFAFFQMHGAWPTSGELKEHDKLLTAQKLQDISNNK